MLYLVFVCPVCFFHLFYTFWLLGVYVQNEECSHVTSILYVFHKIFHSSVLRRTDS